MKLGEAQRRALEYLESARQPMTAQQLAKAVNCSLGPIQQLRRRGLVEETTQRVVWGRVSQQPVEVEQGWHPNAAQQRALDGIRAALQANEFRTFVIHGVTGSGKTEVYIRAIEEVVRSGRQAIVLVPEISLTPQTEQRFRSRFPSVAVLHSHQSPVERHWHWRRIARGEVQVVVGARSAVFAPTPHLGLIVIDEEHDASFKQDSTPRYHAREVARQRCLMQRVPLVLGSATPSLESYQAALRGEATLLPLPHRVLDRPLPHVATIDLRSEFQNRKQRGAISRPLHQAIHQALIDGGQVILLLNRRGYSPIIQCPSCGQAVKCPYCDITLTHHRTGALAVCHYCDYQQATPTHCPNCQSTGIRYVGLGTQRLEAEVRARFPHYECLRMDSDSMQQHGSHEKALARFRQGEVRILLGTQMIAKGLDFPNVTLVGVINADIALHLPNFRAAERTFQLVTQVAGRTGRGEKGGRVLVQTFTPEHPAIIAATRHDFVQFAEGELPCRERFGYPPFGAMVRIIVRGDAVEPVSAWADHLGAALTEALEGQPVRVMGPAPAPIAKLRGKHRYHLLLLGPDGEPLRAAVRDVMQRVKTPDDVQWIADVDPLDML